MKLFAHIWLLILIVGFSILGLQLCTFSIKNILTGLGTVIAVVLTVISLYIVLAGND
jgi:hypothetical protein